MILKIITKQYLTLINLSILKINVVDKSGVLADVTSIFKDYDLSIESFIQKSNQEDKTAELVIITHEAEDSVLKNSLLKISY